MDTILGLLLFFGLGLLGLTTLILSAIYSRSTIAVIVWGVIASILLVLECVFMIWLAGIGAATSGSSGGMTGIVFLISVLSLFIYFPAAILRIRKAQDRN